MGNQKKTVLVSASFEKGKELLIWLKKYAKESDGQFLYWDEFVFTIEQNREYDAVLIFNNPSEKIEILCYPENVIAFMMEPGIYSEHPWMFKGLDKYAEVYSPLNNSSNTILCNGFLGWHVLQDWKSLSNLPVQEKNKQMSCIASGLKQLKGHRLRFDFVNAIKKEFPGIDFFGKGNNYITDKMTGLLPYRYSIAIENTSAPFYFTEKIGDCFLTWTVPVYYGCTNIGQYFPEKSFIQINIEEPQQAIKTIRNVLENNDWESRVEALKEARSLVLNKYQPLAGAASVLRETKQSVKKKIEIKPVRDGLLKKAKVFLGKLTGK